MVFGWKSKKNSDGSTSHYQSEKTVRDVSDDGPVGGFVTEEMLREQEREMEDFANMKKEDFNN